MPLLCHKTVSIRAKAKSYKPFIQVQIKFNTSLPSHLLPEFYSPFSVSRSNVKLNYPLQMEISNEAPRVYDITRGAS